ncbi:RHS repeat-associated core domain-containing protein [Streptomyces sp. NBC_01190]|uniref:RHS repeat-associated core domain-containing protein n=1 Tax=Streptomyces sp. NBC_01190 TaxID=2903767 RepID=UPI003865717E|nr:RHS repeat-associated core domain-containing protein [Streptomyces sp. NBC_01190]
MSGPEGSLQFVGGTPDPLTGLTNLGAREYDPTLGRFLSRDPLLEIRQPQQWNGYAYADDNPANNSDSSGEMLFDDTTGLGFGNVKDLNDYNKAHFPTIKYSKEYRTDVVKDGRGNTYRIGEEKGITQDEVSTRTYLNRKLQEGGEYSDGSDAGTGQQYLPVNPIKGAERGNGTADLVRLTWKGGKLVKADAVDIITPSNEKAETGPYLKSASKKEGQGDEIVFNLKHADDEQAQELIRAVSLSGLRFNAVTVINQSSEYYNEVTSGLSGSMLNNSASVGSPALNPDPVGGDSGGVSGGQGEPYTGPCNCSGADGGPVGGVTDPADILEDLIDGGGDDGIA